MSRWKEFMRGTAAVLAAVVLAGTGIGMPVKATEVTSDIEWKIVDNEVPEFTYQKSQDIKMFIKNNGDYGFPLDISQYHDSLEKSFTLT